ncbi:hypothetical protein [Spirochaeta dissipatitropha]
MKCQRCAEYESEVRLLRSQGSSTELYICSNCADELDISADARVIPLRIDDILDSLLELPQPEPCGTCGTELEAVLRLGKLGCADCLDSFGEELAERLLSRSERQEHALTIQPYHRGGLPDSLEGLRDLLIGSMNDSGTATADQEDPAIEKATERASLSAASTFDVVISSRLEMARSLDEGNAARNSEESVSSSLDGYASIIHELPLPDFRNEMKTDSSSVWPQPKSDTQEKTPEFQLQRDNAGFFLYGDEDLCCIIDGFGYCISDLTEYAETLAGTIDSRFPVRARIDYGYITRSVRLLGSGIGLSVQLHLWALDTLGILHASLNDCDRSHLEWEHLPGSRVILRIRSGFGKKTGEMTEILEAAVLALVHYERVARSDVLQHRHKEWKSMLDERISDINKSDTEMHELVSDLLPAAHAGFWNGMDCRELVQAWARADIEGWDAVRCVIAAATANSKEEYDV